VTERRRSRRRGFGADVLGSISRKTWLRPATAAPKRKALRNLRFRHGDATNLTGIEDHSFDRVVSIFGAMFAPKPFDVAKEMMRVTRLGGRIVMGNWIPGDPTLVAEILRISSAYTPAPPAGFVSPMTWGRENDVMSVFTARASRGIKSGFKRQLHLRLLGYARAVRRRIPELLRPTMNAFEAAAQSGRAEELTRELETLFREHNRSTDPERTRLTATFLRVTVNV